MSQTKPPLGARLDRRSQLAQGLVGCWLFNEGGGINVYDLLRGRAGVLTGMAGGSFDSGRWPNQFGSGIVFDGTNDNVVMPATVVPTAPPFTVSCWIRTLIGGTANRGTVWSWIRNTYPTHGWYVLCLTDGTLEFTAVENDVYRQAATAATLDASQWYHVVAVVESTTSRVLYLNGLSAVTDTRLSTPNPSLVNTFRLGRWRLDLTGASALWLKGGIDNCRVYNRALSQAEVSRLYRDPYAGISVPTRRRVYSSTSAAPNYGRGFFGLM